MTLLAAKPVGKFAPSCLFQPESVAVIGAGSASGRQVVGNLLAGGFRGAVLPVDARLSAISGVLAYRDIAALPITPELAVIAEGGAGEVFAALADKGCFAAIMFGAAEDLREQSRRTGVRVLGPGSFGLAVPEIGLNASRAHLPVPKGRLALVSQSAALCRAVLDWAGPNGVGFSHIVGTGGNADIGFAIVLDWLSRDPGTGAILLDIRLIKDRRAFLSAARAASRLRPVVAIRPGTRLADPTGAAELAFEAALRRAGVLAVSRFEDFLAAAETLSRARPARGEALAIVTNAINPGRLAADAALRDGLSLARLSPETRAALAAHLPPSLEATLDSGVVYVGHDVPQRLAEITARLAAAPEVGGILAVHAPSAADDITAIDALAAGAATAKLPLLVCAMGETTGAAHRRRLAAAGVAAFGRPEQAVRGFLHLVQDRRNRAAARELPPSKVLAVAPDIAAARQQLDAVRQAGRLELLQDEAMAVLAAYGVPAVPYRSVASPADAMAAASSLGFPVVLKLRDSARPGQRPRGSISLDLHNGAEVRVAARLVAARRARRAPAAPDLGLLVQRQIGRAHAMLLRVDDDPVFGPTIAIGHGGTTAELLGDIAMDLPPLNLTLAQALITRTRAAGALHGLRDLPTADIGAVAATLVRVSQLVVDLPEIAALEINPLFVDADGVLVADAWIQLRPAGELGRLAIPPYPAELVERWEANGEHLIIRPIRPEDAEQHGVFFHRLSPEDVRFRFFSAMRELSPEMTARLTQIDYDREMAFVAVREATGETVGVSRLVSEPNGEEGEFAVIVQADMKGKGVAGRLMQRLIDWARTRQMRAVVGQVLADNAPMLAFIRHLGFTVHRLPQEPDVMEARLTLRE